MNEVSIPRKVEAVLLIAIVLIAIIFRFAAFKQVPPGLHYDEAIDAKLAQEIRSGAWPIYFEKGWGREPLYHYLTAFTLNLVPDPTSALRLVSGLLGLIQLLAAYFLFRLLFGVPTALIGAAWIAVLFWTVSTSRAGLRNITLTTLATLTAYFLWRALFKRQAIDNSPQTTESSSLIPHPSSFILPGVLLGLTLYTYQPSRVVPLIYLMFVIYLFWRQREWVMANWKGWLLFFAVAAIVATPLGWFLVTHPTAETARTFQTEPIHALFNGNFAPVLETATATLKMFTVDGGGDPQILYNLTGRPLFIGLGSLLFVIGLIATVFRFKQPAYAFILIWLVIALLPNLVTAPAPFFYRAIAAQTPVAALPAIATVALGTVVNRFTSAQPSSGRRPRLPAWLGGFVIWAIALISLGQTAITTWHDYFDVWANNPEVRFQYSAAYTEIATALQSTSDTSPVAVSGYFSEDADPLIFAQALNRADLPVRWFDAREALIAAAGVDNQRVALPTYTPVAEELRSRFMTNVEPLAQTKDFKIFPFEAASFRTQIAAWTCPVCPATFDNSLALIGLDRPRQVSRSSGVMSILSAWKVLSAGQPSSTAIFIHMLDANGRIVAQDDRLGVPRHTWQPGDEFVQLHHIPLDQLPPGKYTLELGVYNRGDNVRWPAEDQSGQPDGDHILLGQIEVTS